MYNSENEHIWAINRADADEGEMVPCRNKSSPEKGMVWLGACFKGVIPLVILDEGTVDHNCYIKKRTFCSFKIWE